MNDNKDLENKELCNKESDDKELTLTFRWVIGNGIVIWFLSLIVILIGGFC